MTNGRFNASKCRGMLQKMGVLYTHSPKSPSPFSKLPKNKIQKIIKFKKREQVFVIGTDKEKIKQKESLRGRDRESERRGDF
jgi:hypothetical protein